MSMENTVASQQSPLESLDQELMTDFAGQLKALSSIAPEWVHEYDAIDPMVADEERVNALRKEAPNEYAAGMMMGIMLFRQQIRMMSGRDLSAMM